MALLIVKGSDKQVETASVNQSSLSLIKQGRFRRGRRGVRVGLRQGRLGPQIEGPFKESVVVAPFKIGVFSSTHEGVDSDQFGIEIIYEIK